MTSTNDGKDVKSNQTSGPKGKSYYIDLYKFLEARLSEGGDPHQRTTHLCEAWRSVHSLCQHSAPSTHAHLLNWLQRHTARAVLQTEWQTPKRKDDRKILEEAIDAFIGHVSESSKDGSSLSWEVQLVARGEWFKRVLDNPWDHPVLTLLLNPNGTPPTDDEVLAWLSEERGVTFVVRLHTLVGEKCDDIAVSLAAAVMERARASLPPAADPDQQTEAPPVENAAPTFADKLKDEAGFTPDVWELLTDIEFVLLHKRDSKRCIALAKQTPLLDAYPLIERLQKRLEVSPREKRLWKNAKEVAILIAQVVIARCMVVKSCFGAARTALYCCARLLARLLTSRLPGAADALAAQALTARHLHTLAQAVDKQLSPTNEDMKPYVCELYVRAITAGMNELERLKLKTEKEGEARSMEKTLASWFVQLGAVLSRSARIACECTLTAFSLHPSQKMYERIDAAPPLAPVLTDPNESKEETVKSEFGSWASDSRSQTNLVKTSETLNMKHKQNQANVLSTAIFNEGEALGLSPELCQDIAVLLSGPRVKTLSWDMDRTLLLEKCRAYCEVTHEGTRVLTRELKFLNIDPQQYQHLPEEKDDDENDPYYGIERGYEHLAVLDEPEEIWEDANHSEDSECTESASSIEKYYLAPRRKKKAKKVLPSSGDDSDPLSFVAESKRTQKKKERPLSKERSKEPKKKQDLIDPLAIDESSQSQSQPKPKKEPRVKKERKKKEKVPKVIGGKRSSLASLVGIKVIRKKPKAIATVRPPVTVSDSQAKKSLTAPNPEGKDRKAIQEKSIPGAEGKCLELKSNTGIMNNERRVTHGMFGSKCAPSHIPGRAPNNLTKMQYRPQSLNTVRQPSPSDYKTMINNYNKYDDIRANLSKLLEYRRKRDEMKIAQQNKMLQTNISPKSVVIPEIPKSYIDKEQAERLAERARLEKNAKDSVIQYAKKTNVDKLKADFNKSITASGPASSKAQNPSTISMKITDFINPSYDRLMIEIAERQNRGLEALKPAHSQYQSLQSPRPVQHSPRPVHRSLNVLTPGQRDFQNFLKEYEPNKYLTATQAIDMSSKSREGKKPVMPVSRVKPVVPILPIPEPPKPKPQQCPKQPTQQKKPEVSLNTFSRLNYHKNKQNEMKNKIQPPKAKCNTLTYQDVSSELDEIIKEHQRAQMKVIQAKRDNVDRIMKTANSQEPINKYHPLLSNLLQNPALNINSTLIRNEGPLKSNQVQQASPVPPKTSLSEKDSTDLLYLLRQQNKLNNTSQCFSTNIIPKPSTSSISKEPGANSNSNSMQTQQQFSKPLNQNTTAYTSSFESKNINVISDTLLKPGNHEIIKTISANTKPHPKVSKKPVETNCTVTQPTVKKNAASKDQVENKYIPESSKPEWQAVMFDLLRHKTPTRGPNALDVALNKSSFELAFEKNMKEASKLLQSQPAVEKDVTTKHHRKGDRPKPVIPGEPVITSIQNVIITKKGIKLKNEESKRQKDFSDDPKAYSKHTNATNEKIKVHTASVTTKKPPQEVQRKHFTYAGPKNIDPFISGIPNSDYDLLEELMDDDLRKEIGELSSDDDNYNTAAQSFLKPSKSSDKRVSVQFNKCLNEPASELASSPHCLKDRKSTNEMLPLATLTSVSQSTNEMVQTSYVSTSLKVHQKTAIKVQESKANCLMAASTQTASTHTSTATNAPNLAYNSANTLNRQVITEPNVYISAVPQPAPLQNVVIVGQELVYGGYTNIQMPVQSMNNLAPNAYVAVNRTSTMTLYQTTQYTAPVVIGASITVPVMNKISCAAIPVQPSMINNEPQPSYSAVIIEPQTSIADPQVTIKICDTQAKIIGQDQATDSSQQNQKLLKEENSQQNPKRLQEETKISERKVLSEVQDFATAENIDKIRGQKIENNLNMSFKNETVADMERLKNKRLAIVNREIYHRCGESTIPLTYSPLPRKIKNDVAKQDFSEAIPNSYTSLSANEDKQKLSDCEEEKLLAQIKNNLKDLSDAINEVPSPATPDSNDSKENKSFSATPCRRILLRSSNKVISKPNSEETPTQKKTRTKIKSEACVAAAVASDKTQKVKTNEKETDAPKRASKRIRNKKYIITTAEQKPLQRQKPDSKDESSPANKAKSKMQHKSGTEKLEFLDIETELHGSRISKNTVENELENKRRKSIDYVAEAAKLADKANSKSIDCVVDAAIPADKTRKHIITEAPILHKTEFSETVSSKSAVPANDEDIAPGISVHQEPTFLEQRSQTTAIPENEKNKAIIPEKIYVMKTSLSEHSRQNLALPEDIGNKNVTPKMSTAQISLSDQFCQKMPLANNTNKDKILEVTVPKQIGLLEESLLVTNKNRNKDKAKVPFQKQHIISEASKPQKTGHSKQLLRQEIDNKKGTSETIEDVKIDVKYDLEYADKKTNVNMAQESGSNKETEIKENDNNHPIDKNKPCIKIEETTNNAESKLQLDTKASAEVYAAPGFSTGVLITNARNKQLAENDNLDDKIITDQNKSDTPDKDNIDLDMSVTCEEVPMPKLSPVFGNIKIARSKPLTGMKKDVKYGSDVLMNKEIDTGNKNNKSNELSDEVSNNIEINENIKHPIQNVNIEPTPGSWLVKNTPKISPKIEESSIPQFETTATAADMDDDVVIIDDDINTKSVVPLLQPSHSESSVEPVNTQAKILKNNIEPPVVNPPSKRVNDEYSGVKCCTEKSNSSHVLSHSSANKALTEKNEELNPKCSDVKELSKVPQNLREQIRIENLPSKDPMKSRVRVSLPNGRKVIATVSDKVHVTYDTLFAHPVIKEAILNKMNFTKSYVMKVMQVVTVDKSDPNIILSAQLNNIETSQRNAPATPVETIDLLSDDEESGSTQITDTNKQEFITEYGKFTAPLLDKDLFKKHQKKFNQKSKILLKKVDEKPQVANVVTTPRSTKNNAVSDITPLIPDQYLKGLMIDIKNKLVSKVTNTPIVNPEVVELDDSSNDSVYQGESAEIIKEDKTIHELKDVLLKELGVAVPAKSLQEETINDDDVEIIGTMLPQKNSNRRKMLKLSAIPAGKSCPFEDLDEEEQLQIKKRKCTIKLIRCDNLAKKYERNNTATVQSSAHNVDEEPITITDDFTIFNDFDEKIVEEERSSSPVIELLDVLVSLHNKSLAISTPVVHRAVPVSCEANWHSTKSSLHLLSVDNAVIVKDTVSENGANISDEDLIDAIPLACEANWLTTKYMLHVQGVNDETLVRSHVSEYDEDVCDASVVDKVITLSCKSNWLVTKSMLHLQSFNAISHERSPVFENDINIFDVSMINKAFPPPCEADWLKTKSTLLLQDVNEMTLARPVSEYDDEMCDDSLSAQGNPLSCEANWLTTKPTLYLQGVNVETSARSNVSECDDGMCDDSLSEKVNPLSCEANWLTTKPTLHLQVVNDETLARSNDSEYDDEMRDDGLNDQVIPMSCDNNWLTTKSTLHLQGVKEGKVLRSNVSEYDDEMCDDRLKDQAYPLSCEANWLTTKHTLHMQGVNDEMLASSNSEDDDEICDDRLRDQVIPLTCHAYWLTTTKSSLHLQAVHDETFSRSNVSEYEDEKCDDSLEDQAYPLSCEANWLTSKSMLHLQDFNEKTVLSSNSDCDYEMTDDRLRHQVIPLSCDANWLTSKPTLHLQSFNDQLVLCNDREFTKLCNKVLLHNVTPLSCEAPWFATKTSLHLEVHNNMRSNDLTDGKNRCFTGCSPSNVVEVTKTIQLQTHPPIAPSLVSLVLQSFQNTNVIHQYSRLCKNSPINLLKRKSPSLRSSATWKASKLNETAKTKFIDCNYLTTVAIETSSNNTETITGQILRDTKIDSHFGNMSEDKSLKSPVSVTSCDDNHNLNVSTDDENQHSEPDDCGYTDIEVTDKDSDTNVGSFSDKHAFLLSSDNTDEESAEYVRICNECRSPSPGNDTINLLTFENDTSIQHDEHNSHYSQPPSPIIPIENFLKGNIKHNWCTDVSELSLESENTKEKQENINDSDDSSTTCTSIQAEKSASCSLEPECTNLRSSTYKIETRPSENSTHFDEIEVKLSGIFGESLIEPKNTTFSQKTKDDMSDSKKSEIIRIILEDEPFAKTGSKENTCVSHDEEKGFCPDTEIPVNECWKTKDHEYFASFDAASVLGSIDESSIDNQEIIYVSTDDAIFLSDNESVIELEEEIVDMCSDDIVDDILHDTTACVHFIEADSEKLSDQANGLECLENSASTTTKTNSICQVAIKQNNDIVLRKEKDCQKAIKDCLIENCIDATEDGDEMEESTLKLSSDLSAESIMNKYLALIRNKSEVLGSVVEYEDPEAGTCYVIPIIQESSDTNIDSIEDTKVFESVAESPKIKEKKVKVANVENSLQSNTISPTKVVNKHSESNYEDIEARLAEIVGESFSENEIIKSSTQKNSLEEKYKTSYLVEVEAISSPKEYVENIACPLKGADQDKKKASVKSLNSNSIPGVGKKRSSKYHDKPDKLSIIEKTKNLKVILPKLVLAKNTKEINQNLKRKNTKEINQNLKRKVDMTLTITSERKYRKGNPAKPVEIDGESITENEVKNTSTSSHKIRLDEKYKTSYIVEVESISNSESDAEIFTSPLKQTDDDRQKTLVKSSEQQTISGASKRKRSKHRDMSEDVSNVTNIENFRVKLPKHTYSKVTEQIQTRKRCVKRTIDVSDTKTSERKYRKGKNIDYPRFTAASLCETVYAKEYKTLIDYCSTVKFSFAVPFHKENIDVHDKLKSWPIKNTHSQTIEQSVEANTTLFIENEKSEALLDPLTQTLPEELTSKFDENSYTPSNIQETNFNMGFGERSGRVIQESKDGEYTTFSAATLSDVKQLQPLLPSDEKETIVQSTRGYDNHDLKHTTKLFVDHLYLREKVRSFFENTRAELALEWNHKKGESKNDDLSDWPFGDLTSTRCFQPSPVELTLNVFPEGQFPVSAVAYNPITRDPSVTQVFNASTTRCSPENSLYNELQTAIKTQYSELTTTDITLPLMQEYMQNHLISSESQKPTNLSAANGSTTQFKSIDEIELMSETSPQNEKNNEDYERNGSQQIPNYVVTESNSIAAAKSAITPKSTIRFLEDKQNDPVEKPDQLAYGINVADIFARALAKTENKNHDQKLKTNRFVDHLHLREKVRSFFEKTRAELAFEWKFYSKKGDSKNDSEISDWPFSDLTSTKYFDPSPEEITVNVVQVGQLPVSAAAQNPVTCDPRVTHVSNASPSQCSPENVLGDELQTPIKTEYTELTTADITLPMMQEYVQHHSIPSESQQPANLYATNDNTAQIKSIVKIELMEETSQENEEDDVDYENNGFQQLSNGDMSNSVQFQFANNPNNVATESGSIAAANSSKTPKTTVKFSEDKQNNEHLEKPDQLAHAMNAAGISSTRSLAKTNISIDVMQQSQPNVVVSPTATTTTNYSKTTPINAIALQQALAQILPPPLNQAINTNENNPQTSTNQQVLHIVQGNNAQSVINKPNGTQLLHIVQNKGVANTNASNLPASQQNTFGGLSLVDGTLQQSGNQLLHIVNTANQKSTNAGQLLKRVNLLTNLANVQGSNEQKMVQFVCKSADGKSIQLPHQRSMVLRLQPLDQPNIPTAPKQNDNQDHSSTPGSTHSVNEKESNPQEMKSRSLYEENYAKFVQDDAKFAQNGDPGPGPEKATSLPKFNQVFGKQVYQDKQNEMNSENLPETPDAPEENNAPLEQMNDITNPPMLIRKTNSTQPSLVQPNLVQQIKQTIGPMNIQTMHGGVIYTRQIPVNLGNGQTINLITVPSTELVEDSAQKQLTDSKFGNQEGDPPIIKIVPTNQPAATPNGSTDDNASVRSTNNTNPQPNPQPQPVLTQMRIKLPMLSKAPQMVGGTRVMRPSFFQIQRNVIGGANQQVYQQLVLTAAPPLGQTIRLPAQVQKPKTPSETQSSPESQMSSSTLEQLREFDMVLEQVKERSTVQPGSSTSSTNNFTKLKSSPDTTDSPTPSKSTQESPTQILFSVGNTQPLNMVSYVNRKSTITSTTSSAFVRSPDSTGTVDSPSSSTPSHLPHTVTSDSCASSSCASEAAAATTAQPKSKKKKPKPSTSNSNPFNIKNTPKPTSQKPLEDEQTTQRILYILAEYKEQVENSPDKDKPAPRRRNNPAAPNAGSSKRKKSSSGSRRRDMSPVLGEDSCRTMGSEDSSCGTSLGECNECLETHSPEESPKKVVRRLTFEQDTQVTQTRTTTTTATTTTTVPQRNVIVTDGQAFAVRGATGKPATTVLMPANYLLPVSMVKGGQQIAIVTNRGPKLLVGAGEGGAGGALLFQRLIGPGGLKPMLARPGVRHIRLPTAALHNLQAFNIAAPATANVQPPDSTASPAPAPAPPDLVDTRAMSSPWPDRDAGEVKPERGNSSPEGSEPWNLPSSSIADDYGYEEIVRTDNMDRTVLDAIPDRYSPDLEAQRIFDKMFDSDSKKSMYDSRCGYDIDASDDDKAYHQVVHRKDGRHTTRLTHVSAAALRHKYAILEHELRLQKSLSEECEDLGVDSPSASELFPEAELLFAPSPAHEQTIDQCHTPQPTMHTHCIPQPDLDDQIATDHLLTHKERHDDLDINLDDVGEIVTVGEDGMTTIPLDHEEFARSHEEFARSHPNTTFHSEPEDGEGPPFTIAQGVKGRQITFHPRGVPVVMAPQTTVISQATVEAAGTQNAVKFSDIDNMINAMPSAQHGHITMPSVLKESSESLTKFDRLLNESREMNLSNTPSAIVHSTGNGTQVIRRVQYERRDSRYLVEDDAMIAGDSKTDERRDMMDEPPSPERHSELFWDAQSRLERKRFDFSSDSDKCCKSPYDEANSDSSGIGAHTRLDSVIKAARPERRRSDGSSAEDSHPPLRTYPPKRTHQHTHHSHHHDVDRSLTGKTRASDRCHDVKDESRRRASNRGVVKRGCHCCNGSTPPKPKKSRQKKSSDYPHN